MDDNPDTLFQTQVLESGFTKQQENFLLSMHESGVKRIEKAVTKSIDARFVTYGFKIDDPLSIQEDQIVLKKLKNLMNSISSKSVMFVFALILSLVGLGAYLKLFITNGKVGS